LIQLHDKKFEPYISEQQIASAILALAEQINMAYAQKNVLVLSVLNGSFMFCADLVKKLKCTPEIHFVKLQSYQGTQTTGNVNTLVGLPSGLKNRNVLVLEDIVDTGNTISVLKDMLQKEQASSIEIATLLYKPNAFLAKNPPKFVGIEIPDNFVVGFGLDYNGLGREIPSIYQLKG
jgi:adenylate kinase